MPAPAHVLQVRAALMRAADACPPEPWAAAVGWLNSDMPLPIKGYTFRLETERTPERLGEEPRWRHVLRYARAGLRDGDFLWNTLISVEA